MRCYLVESYLKTALTSIENCLIISWIKSYLFMLTETSSGDSAISRKEFKFEIPERISPISPIEGYPVLIRTFRFFSSVSVLSDFRLRRRVMMVTSEKMNVSELFILSLMKLLLFLSAGLLNH